MGGTYSKARKACGSGSLKIDQTTLLISATGPVCPSKHSNSSTFFHLRPPQSPPPPPTNMPPDPFPPPLPDRTHPPSTHPQSRQPASQPPAEPKPLPLTSHLLPLPAVDFARHPDAPESFNCTADVRLLQTTLEYLTMPNSNPSNPRFTLTRGTLEPLPFRNGSPTEPKNPIDATGTATATEPPQQPQNIHIKHCLFQRTVAGQLAMANPNTVIHTKQGLAEMQKHWEKVNPNGTAVLSTVVQQVTWAQFQLEALGKTKQHLGTHIDLMDACGLIKWQGAVKKHAVFGVGRNTVIASDADFDSYVDAILANPNSEVIIWVIMADPRRTAKERESERAQSDALAIAYGSNDDRLALERTSARVARNASLLFCCVTFIPGRGLICLVCQPHADVDAQERMRITQELYEYHRQLYGGNRESMRVKDPADPARSFRVTADGYKTWSMAILHGAHGVDQDTPPKTDQFVSEKEAVYTLAELAAQATNWLSKHKSAAAAQEILPSGPPTHVTSTPAVAKAPPRPPVFASVARKPSLSGAASTHPRSPAHLTRATLPPAGGDSTPATPVFTPARRTASSRFIPPRLVSSAPGAQPSPPAPDGTALASPTKAAREPLIPQLMGAEGVGDELDVSDTEDAPFSPVGSVRMCSTRHNSLASTDIEILPPPKSYMDSKGNVHRSPARKLARSPHGDGIAHTISRLNFGRPRSPTRGRPVSPTRKTPASRSRSDSMASWMTESVPTADYPLNKAGKALTIEGFLDLLCFDKGDVITRGLLAMSHIRRWDFFLQTSPKVLEEKLGFPYPIACQLVKGATWLIPTHVIVPNAKGLPTAAARADSVVIPPAHVKEDPGSALVATNTATVGLACASSSGSIGRGRGSPAPRGE
ncbi:hypothetical protein PTTG_30166 [Puccinia triticina 1-1 BBBD Race 1]|uniref:Uncharacterized protein n=1 Tax=Puccinia triticina (isolate 1-1 / race 1 (BBBD)) TaxID=630390 RepID=A0A180FZZ1_PUCT1|nr:hypothetical protein PTTG_30166 [Puccinia triticina 1-1 BBBD Race 1]